MLAVRIRQNLHQDERAALALDDARHRAKRRASNLVACGASAPIAFRQSMTASRSASNVLHRMERVIVAGTSDCDSKNVMHGVQSRRARERLVRR